MTGFMEDNFLRMEGLDDNDIANINRILPDLQNLIAIAESHQVQFNRVMTVLFPIAQKIIAKQRSLSQ